MAHTNVLEAAIKTAKQNLLTGNRTLVS